MKKVTFASILASLVLGLCGLAFFLWSTNAQTESATPGSSIEVVEEKVDLTGLTKIVYSAEIKHLDPDNKIVFNGNKYPETKRPIASFEWEEYCSKRAVNSMPNFEEYKKSMMRRSIFGLLSSDDKYFNYFDAYQLEKDIQEDIIKRYNGQSPVTSCKAAKFTKFKFELTK